MNEERLINIETKLAYMEKVIKDLNEVVCKQQKEIEKTNAICTKLLKMGKEYEQVISGINAPADEKPPHY
ncbi:MAG: SlyX family protein [Desulfobacula sp.]|nr:SlyX family protein [Desulfobacula sp.]